MKYEVTRQIHKRPESRQWNNQHATVGSILIQTRTRQSYHCFWHGAGLDLDFRLTYVLNWRESIYWGLLLLLWLWVLHLLFGCALSSPPPLYFMGVRPAVPPEHTSRHVVIALRSACHTRQIRTSRATLCYRLLRPLNCLSRHPLGFTVSTSCLLADTNVCTSTACELRIRFGK
jgi:hypothetical protein